MFSLIFLPKARPGLVLTIVSERFSGNWKMQGTKLAPPLPSVSSGSLMSFSLSPPPSLSNKLWLSLSHFSAGGGGGEREELDYSPAGKENFSGLFSGQIELLLLLLCVKIKEGKGGKVGYIVSDEGPCKVISREVGPRARCAAD